MKIYCNSNCPGLRDKFVEEINTVFGSGSFSDYLEDEGGYDNTIYNCYVHYDDECYIINRLTGEYINWYKFNHFGRDIHMNFNPDEMHRFMVDFYNNHDEDFCNWKKERILKLIVDSVSSFNNAAQILII